MPSLFCTNGKAQLFLMPAFPPSLGESISSFFKRHSVGWVLLKSFFFYNVMVFTTPMRFPHRWCYRISQQFLSFLKRQFKGQPSCTLAKKHEAQHMKCNDQGVVLHEGCDARRHRRPQVARSNIKIVNSVHVGLSLSNGTISTSWCYVYGHEQKFKGQISYKVFYFYLFWLFFFFFSFILFGAKLWALPATANTLAIPVNLLLHMSQQTRKALEQTKLLYFLMCCLLLFVGDRQGPLDQCKALSAPTK